MKLPGVERAVIDDAELRDYLISDSHSVGKYKARFFATLGYDAANWTRLADELLRHAAENEVESTEATAFGTKYRVVGALRGQNGKSARILVVWIVLHGENVPRLTTAHPKRGRP